MGNLPYSSCCSDWSAYAEVLFLAVISILILNAVFTVLQFKISSRKFNWRKNNKIKIEIVNKNNCPLLTNFKMTMSHFQ